jgi:hypothetical protein
MISRVAEACFWLHRYMERADNTARLLRVNHSFVLDVSLPGAQVTLGTPPTEIPADSLLVIPVEVVKTGALASGTIEADYAWRMPRRVRHINSNPSSKTSPLIPPGFFFETEYVIELAVFDPA